MMKLGTVIPYQKKIQKIYKPRDKPISILYRKSETFIMSRNIADTDTIINADIRICRIFKGYYNKYGYNFDDISKIGYSICSLK